MTQSPTPATLEAGEEYPEPPGPAGAELTEAIRRYDLDSLVESERLFQTYGDVVQLRRGPFVTIFLFHPDHARHVLVDRVAQYSRRTTAAAQLEASIGRGLVTAYGAEWARMRRLTQPGFTKKQLDASLEGINGSARDLVERWKSIDTTVGVDVYQDCGFALLNTIGQLLVGETFSLDEVEVIRRAIDVAEAVDRGMPRQVMLDKDVSAAHPEAIQAYQSRYSDWIAAQAKFDELLNRLMSKIELESDESVGSRGGWVASLSRAKDEDGSAFTSQEVIGQLKTLLVAGHATTMSSVAFTLFALAKNPEALEHLRSEVGLFSESGNFGPKELEQMSYLDATIAETLRICPPVAHIDRRAEEADVIGGYRIPRGAAVALSPYVVHRRADIWDEPLAFRPERFLSKPPLGYFPFGLGQHTCVGRSLALAEAKVFVAWIVRAFEPSPVEGFELQMRTSITVHPRDGLLPLRLRPRS